MTYNNCKKLISNNTVTYEVKVLTAQLWKSMYRLTMAKNNFHTRERMEEVLNAANAHLDSLTSSLQLQIC